MDNFQKGMAMMAAAQRLMSTPSAPVAQPGAPVAPVAPVAQPGAPVAPVAPVAQPGAPVAAPAVPPMPVQFAQPQLQPLTLDQIAAMSPDQINASWDSVKAVLDAQPVQQGVVT